MTLDSPLWLGLLLALPLLWWLHRRLLAPREVVVASVEPLRGAPRDARGPAPRRTPDPDLVLLLVAAACLATAAAGPRLGSAAPTALVALDTSWSMTAPGADGARIGDRAWAAALGSVASAAGDDAEIVAVDLAAPETAERIPVAGVVPFPFAPVTDDLPRSLAPVLARAERGGFPGVLLVTDRVLAAVDGVVVSGPPAPPVPTPEVLDVVLDARTAPGVARVTVRRAGGQPRALLVTGAEGAASVEVPVPPGAGVVDVDAPAPPRGEAATYAPAPLHEPRSERPGTAVVARRIGGVRTVRLRGPGSGRAPRIRALLASLRVGTAADELAPVDLEIVIGGPPLPSAAGAPVPRLHVAAAAGEARGVEVLPAEAAVAAERVSASGHLADAVPSPGVPLVRTGVLRCADGAPTGAWRAPDGMLAAALPGQVVTTLDPETPLSAWHTDPSFPVFVLAAFEHLAGGPDRLEIVDGAPREERMSDGPPPAPAGPADVASLVRPPERDPASRPLGGALAAVAAGLLAITVVRARGRFSNG